MTQVLLPTASLDTVPPPGNGLTAGQAAGQLPGGGIAGLFPGLRIGNKQVLPDPPASCLWIENVVT